MPLSPGNCRTGAWLVCASAFALLSACQPGDEVQPEPQADAVAVQALSTGGTAFSASVPEIAVDPSNSQRVAIIWRDLAMTRPGEPAGERGMSCHLSLSEDGGRSFTTRKLEWNMPDTPVCNSPYVDIGPDGELLMGATLAGVLPQNAPEGEHAAGRVVMRLSTDWGASWSPISSGIATGDEERFEANPTVPAEATHVPWDGGRGVIDASSGAIILSGGYPAPPGEDLRSQRFYTVSPDRGQSWGPIRAFGAPGWPQRWDGHYVVAHGVLAFSYLAEAVPVEGAKCLCVVFASSPDGGATVERHLVAQVDFFDRLVHYPPIAAHPARKGAYVLALASDKLGYPSVRVTSDGGKSWREMGGLVAPDGVVRSSRPALAYAPDGTLALLWRGYHADGSYDMYMAASTDGERFGAARRILEASSLVPEELTKDYSSGGDFISSLGAGTDAFHAAWTGWREGEAGQVLYARVPLAQLLPER
ncbi:MAG: glycoside hydrolase [Alphaproteobacteria bacterium]|nr:glycoside hydrolase [Alphaproteobacteria bacterium]MBU0876045.1 glycoside hydrolase [Alphaproteobacteria bacterium]